MDATSISLWITDLILLGLAYWIGRIHGGYILGDLYAKSLRTLLDEVRALRHKVDRLR